MTVDIMKSLMSSEMDLKALSVLKLKFTKFGTFIKKEITMADYCMASLTPNPPFPPLLE
jgi:hypothetical protein